MMKKKRMMKNNIDSIIKNDLNSYDFNDTKKNN